jgi:hypothetical protein
MRHRERGRAAERQLPAMHIPLPRWGHQRSLVLHKRSALTGGVRTGHRLPRIGQTVLLTPQKNGNGPCPTPVTFFRQA